MRRFLAALHQLRSRNIVMTAAAAKEHQGHQSVPDDKREQGAQPRAIQPCLDIGTSLLDVHTVVAQTMVRMSIAASAPSKTNWPPLSEARFVVNPYAGCRNVEVKEGQQLRPSAGLIR